MFLFKFKFYFNLATPHITLVGFLFYFQIKFLNYLTITVLIVAPEVLQNENTSLFSRRKEYDLSCDIWSLGKCQM